MKKLIASIVIVSAFMILTWGAQIGFSTENGTFSDLTDPILSGTSNVESEDDKFSSGSETDNSLKKRNSKTDDFDPSFESVEEINLSSGLRGNLNKGLENFKEKTLSSGHDFRSRIEEVSLENRKKAEKEVSELSEDLSNRLRKIICEEICE